MQLHFYLFNRESRHLQRKNATATKQSGATCKFWRCLTSATEAATHASALARERPWRRSVLADVTTWATSIQIWICHVIWITTSRARSVNVDWSDSGYAYPRMAAKLEEWGLGMREFSKLRMELNEWNRINGIELNESTNQSIELASYRIS